MQNNNKNGGDLKDKQRELLNKTDTEFANETYEHGAVSEFNNDPSRGDNIESQMKFGGRNQYQPLGWDEPIDTSKLNYNYGETIKAVDTQQFTNQDGTLNVPHPNQAQMQREWDARYPKMNGIPVVGVKKNGRGDIVEFKLASGQLVSYEEALRPDVSLDGMVIGKNREGEDVIRSAPDGFRSNNLDELPEYN